MTGDAESCLLNNEKGGQVNRRRLVIAAAAALIAVGWWLCGWQLLRTREWRDEEFEFAEFGPVTKRGRILAADGSPLAYTVRVWRFHVDPLIPERKTGFAIHYVKDVAEGLRLDELKVREAYLNKSSRYVFLADAEDGGPAHEWYVRNRSLAKRAGLIRKPVQKRVYPLGAAAAAVVGFMHGEPDLPAPPQGAGGLEWAFDKKLSVMAAVASAVSAAPDGSSESEPWRQQGADIQTTLVPGVQKALAAALAAACATNGAESAFALVMKVASGEIAAMASWPTFDPSMRRTFDKWDPEMAMNRAAQTVFEPGGLAKPIVRAITLDCGVAADVTNAISSVGVEKFHAALRRFGFGSKTGTAGISGEEVGILASKPEFWEIDTTAPGSVGMGHGFAATGLQVAQAYATLANHGTLVRPVLVRGEAAAESRQIVSTNAAAAVVRMLKSPMPSTVQMCERDSETRQTVYSPTNFVASCAGFHPAEKPEYVVVVSFTKPKSAHTSEEVAVPAWCGIADQLSLQKD